MSEYLSSILEKYKAKGEDEQRFMDKHTDNVQVTDGPGKKEHDAAAAKAKKHKRSPHKGYEPGEDEEVYESADFFSIDDVRQALTEVELDEETIFAVEENLQDHSPTHFLNIIDEAVQEFYQEEADEEEKAWIDEMLESDESFEKFLDMIFEEDDEDEDDDEEENDKKKKDKS